MKTGGDSMYRHHGRSIAEDGQQGIAALSIASAHPSDVAVERPGLDQFRKCQLGSLDQRLALDLR
ncbi:hypothetical protein [Mycobacterium sp. 852002-51971_SCH5477799-a]|uniref:hypothetical protein n=1 Tax=Mycobacterium sp. 852002-51971_SCH5477799-a TaxID=1834106 RepID=UPI0012E97385|nr:hypothetical protein [Mycobacterium sp. 852002-51971_SCH5477799-a]